MSRFIKLYDDELDRLQTLSDLKVYKYLKVEYSYYKDMFYDLQKALVKKTGLSEKTIKNSIKSLKDSGLITVQKKGRYNYYKLPLVDKNEKIAPIVNINQNTEVSPTEDLDEKVSTYAGLTIDDFREYSESFKEKLRQDYFIHCAI